MTKLLLLFVLLKIAKTLAESVLSFMNKSYYSDESRQVRAQKVLGIESAEFSKIVSYTRDKFVYGFVSAWLNVAILLAFITLGGFTFLEGTALKLAGLWEGGAIVTGLSFWALLGVLSFVWELPFELYFIFRIEEKHGFNRQTLKSFLSDKMKGIVMGTILGGGLLALVLFVMEAGSNWWLWAWGVTSFFGVLVSWMYPTVLAPIFNKFTPLPDGELKEQITSLAARVEFKLGDIFIMDASKRSSHGNAYFTGLFGKKRIVLFDTLVETLNPGEIVAVLAHELGHFKLNHVRVGLFRSIALMGLLFYAMSLVKPLIPFYEAFGLEGVSNYAALVVFGLWYGLVDFFFTPIISWLSRRNEFAADAFAKLHMDGYESLAQALVKLQKTNQSMPLAHPLFSRFYYSHPPLLERLDALQA